MADEEIITLEGKVGTVSLGMGGGLDDCIILILNGNDGEQYLIQTPFQEDEQRENEHTPGKFSGNFFERLKEHRGKRIRVTATREYKEETTVDDSEELFGEMPPLYTSRTYTFMEA